MPLHGSEGLADRLRPSAPCFSAAVWRHVLVLAAGALLAPGRRPGPAVPQSKLSDVIQVPAIS